MRAETERLVEDISSRGLYEMARNAKRKVFCIGFHKTGTTTMAEALRVLGYRVTGPNNTKDHDIADKMERIVKKISFKYDAFQDNPWPLVYRQMDELHPGSRFILTIRDEDMWYQSILKQFGDNPGPMREVIYGREAPFPAGNEDLYKARMRRHNEEVREYFKDRPGDLLVMELMPNLTWERLCAFLGERVPSVRFPHANSASQRNVRNRLRKKWGFFGRIAGRFVNDA